jgi:hypothetical protein
MNTRMLTRLAGMAKLVGFLAPYSRGSAEAAVDQLLDASIAVVERGKGNVSDLSRQTVPVALHTMALAVDRHGLRWDEVRREGFRQILGRIPVPRRFEYWDLFRPIVDRASSIIIPHTKGGEPS